MQNNYLRLFTFNFDTKSSLHSLTRTPFFIARISSLNIVYVYLWRIGVISSAITDWGINESQHGLPETKIGLTHGAS